MSKKNAKREVILTSRDEKLFHLLFENKVLSLEQIENDIFNIGRKTIYKRLKKLTDAKLISKTPHLFGKNRPASLISLTPKGARTLSLSKLDLARYGIKLRSDSIVHDLLLAKIRGVLEKQEKVLEYKTENMIALEDSLDNNLFGLFVELGTDAAVKLQLTPKWKCWIPIEFELAVKSINRCKEKLQRYYLENSIVALFLIFESHFLLKRYQELEKEIDRNKCQKVFYLEIKELLNAKGKVSFKRLDGRVLNLHRVAT